ncbi:hypothetical protein DPMN_001496 [Dreissena polymorpha]|uniref:Uncharacterized protein n=1 Tax=Dreissena polymorpha TaxID=45954 RepID=A0A9D4RQE6_DREPO|nr:hypothetical protein DPMN_001496 [Dreissena polymorpha]
MYFEPDDGALPFVVVVVMYGSGSGYGMVFVDRGSAGTVLRFARLMARSNVSVLPTAARTCNL